MSAENREHYCAFCGLPLPGGIHLGRDAPRSEFDYCCTGCRAVASVEQAEGAQGIAADGLLRLGLAIFFTMNVMVFTMALWSYDVYPEQPFETPLAVALRSVFRWATLLFSLPVCWLLGGPIVAGVRQSLRNRLITTDLLILAGVAAAYGYSVISVIRGAGHVYFEVGSMVLLFVSLGRWLEAKGKLRTNESLDRLSSLLPKTVQRLHPNGEFREVRREDAATGDILRVLAGERVPVDGIIRSGQAHVDEQIVSGESCYAVRSAGDQVFAGTLNTDGDLRVEVSAGDGQESLTRLIELVRAARSVKGRRQRLADRIATWFVPLVFGVSIFAGWRQGSMHGIDQGIMTGLAVALIACPCALGLATPMAIWTALGRAAESGVLFRSGLVLEKLVRVSCACFDKSGTLTQSQPTATKVAVAHPHLRAQVLQTAASVAAGSGHQLSKSIVDFARRRLPRLTSLNELSVVTEPGKGIVGEHPTLGRVVLGSRRWMDELNFSLSTALREQLDKHPASQLVLVGWSDEVQGAFCFDDVARPEAAEALAACRQLGLHVQVLTGDAAERADAIGRELNLPAQGNQLPEDKYAEVALLSKRRGVAMIGDGLNDAPALSAADVGVALGCGADVSREAAGVCLLSNDLRRFPWAVSLARTTTRVISQNLFWAFAYNAIGIVLAATGRLTPIWAALAMAVSSLFVVTNSLRLRRFPASLDGRHALPNDNDAVRANTDNASTAATTTRELAGVA